MNRQRIQAESTPSLASIDGLLPSLVRPHREPNVRRITSNQLDWRSNRLSLSLLQWLAWSLAPLQHRVIWALGSWPSGSASRSSSSVPCYIVYASNRCGCARHTGTRISPTFFTGLRLSGLLGNSFPMFPFQWDSKTARNRYMAASAEAAGHYKAGHSATASCPKCNGAIEVKTHVADQRHKYSIISCKCGKCNTTVRLSPP